MIISAPDAEIQKKTVIMFSGSTLYQSSYGKISKSHGFVELVYLVWMIWFSRNKLVHENKIIIGEDLSLRATNYIKELDRVNDRKHTSVSANRQSQARTETKATIFFYAAFDSRNAKSTSGLVVRGKENDWLVSKSVLHSAISSPFMAEAQAGLQAVKLGISMGFQTVTIIGDSKSVIKKCKSTEIDKSVIGAIISDIQRQKQFYQQCYFRFVNRTDNGEAHNIAVETLRTEEEIYLENKAFIRPQSGGEENEASDLEIEDVGHLQPRRVRDLADGVLIRFQQGGEGNGEGDLVNQAFRDGEENEASDLEIEDVGRLQPGGGVRDLADGVLIRFQQGGEGNGEGDLVNQASREGEENARWDPD
ncbi:glycine, alanine and asparagine-rich protein-like [Gossypium australe]|uniref:Glycine, alanine and asparagine-rich protein-like n=1 Tax=Gossypium australe TaxID=47621 RepID=A0A5B6VHX0_9ROSI|nr:glycine, alanine and asparagine-rich protein-like [Gossypium australe]